MSPVNVTAKREQCIGAGLCVLTAPEVFEHDEEEGLVTVLNATPSADLRDKVSQAHELCPARAIELAG